VCTGVCAQGCVYRCVCIGVCVCTGVPHLGERGRVQPQGRQLPVHAVDHHHVGRRQQAVEGLPAPAAADVQTRLALADVREVGEGGGHQGLVGGGNGL
jgi:hypothetical protein